MTSKIRQTFILLYFKHKSIAKRLRDEIDERTYYGKIIYSLFTITMDKQYETNLSSFSSPFNDLKCQ